MAIFAAKIDAPNSIFGQGSTPQPARELTALPTPQSGFNGPTSMEIEGMEEDIVYLWV